MSEEQRSGVDLQEAVRIAIASVRKLYKAQGFELRDLLLEEVERSEDVWLVTVGFSRPNTSDLGAIGQALASTAGTPRAYKRVKIGAKTGEFLGMQIRELQAPSQSQQAR